MITKSKTPVPTPIKGTTIRDRRPAGVPSRAASTRRRPTLRRELKRGQSTGTRAHIGIFETVLHSVLSFAGAALAVSCVVSLAGNVMLEASRRGTIESQNRLRAETAGREDLKGRLAAVASSEAIDRWATEHGFFAADETPMVPETHESRSLVARR